MHTIQAESAKTFTSDRLRRVDFVFQHPVDNTPNWTIPSIARTCRRVGVPDTKEEV